MRFQLVAEVIGDAYAERALTAIHNGILVELQVDPATMRITHVSLEVPADDIALSLSKRAQLPRPNLKFSVPPAPRFEEMRALLQYLESTGSFWLSIDQINWAEPDFHWIAESEEERDLLDLFALSLSRHYEPNRVLVTGHIIEYILKSEPALSRYTVPLAFYREGQREHKAKRYLYAFFNYYFVIEDFFADGQFGTRAVEKAFLQSDKLRRASEFTLRRLIGSEGTNHLDALTRLGQRVGCAADLDGMIKLIVRMRGNLHHFSSNSPRPKGHPLNQDDYESLSVLIGGICVAVVADLMPGGGPGSMHRI